MGLMLRFWFYFHKVLLIYGRVVEALEVTDKQVDEYWFGREFDKITKNK